MAVQISSIEQFTSLKQKRDVLSRQMATLEGKLGASRDRYNEIMRELAKYGIGSVEELHSKIKQLDSEIGKSLKEAESKLIQMEKDLRSVNQGV